MVGRGEQSRDSEGNTTTHWALDWPALHVVLRIRHPVVLEDDPADLLDGLLAIRLTLNTSPADYVFDRLRGGSDG